MSDNLAKSRRKTVFVIPTKVGIQKIPLVIESLDPGHSTTLMALSQPKGFHRGDDLLRVHHE